MLGFVLQGPDRRGDPGPGSYVGRWLVGALDVLAYSVDGDCEMFWWSERRINYVPAVFYYHRLVTYFE